MVKVHHRSGLTMTGFGQCGSHLLDVKGSQTIEEGFVQKGNNGC